MSVLRDRIASLAYGRDKDTTIVSNDLVVVGLNQAATDIPLVQVQIHANGISYQDLQPLVASDGAPISATMPGHWGQLYAVGRT
jgi:hypothetical protein